LLKTGESVPAQVTKDGILLLLPRRGELEPDQVIVLELRRN
jgi:hypothetical protein